MSNNLSIVIPSRNRALQLHLLLESLSKNLKCPIDIFISWQATGPKHLSSYQSLQKNISTKNEFSGLKSNKCSLIWRQRRGAITEFVDVVREIQSENLLIVVDDDIFYREVDFRSLSAFIEFKNNKKYLGLSLRLGENTSSKLHNSMLYAENNINKVANHNNSLLSVAKPRFLNNLIGFDIEPGAINDDFLVWNWLFNLDACGWACINSCTGHIYRTQQYLDWLKNKGKGNFLWTENSAKQANIKEAVGSVAYFFAKVIDKVLIQLQRSFNLYPNEFAMILLGKMFAIRRLNQKHLYISTRNSILWTCEFEDLSEDEKVQIYNRGQKINYNKLRSLSPSRERHVGKLGGAIEFIEN